MLPLKLAAQEIGVPYETVKRYYRAGKIPTQQIGRYQLVDPTVLQALLQANHYRPKKK